MFTYDTKVPFPIFEEIAFKKKYLAFFKLYFVIYLSILRVFQKILGEGLKIIILIYVLLW